METHHERKDIIYIIDYWYDQSGSSEQYTIPLDNSVTLPKGITPLSNNIAHCEVVISKKLNSRKQKCGNQIFKLDKARSAVSKGAIP